MKTRFYQIEVFVNGKWKEFDGREYTHKEANQLLNELKDVSDYPLRSVFLRATETQTLYAL